MTVTKNQIQSALARLWHHAGAGVAVVLVVLALFVGYRIGRPTSTAGSSVDSGSPSADGATDDVWYTCSMHPSVRLHDPNAKCPICFMDLIPVTSGASGPDEARQLSLSPAAAARARVETARVSRRSPTAEVRLYGKVAYDETSVARLTAYFPGRIDRLFVNYVGVPVAKGDHLAEVYSPELLAAFEELRQSREAVDESRSGSGLVRETTRDTLAAAREKLRLYGLTEDQIASIEDRSYTSDRLTIYAPIGGVVTHLAVREGDYVETGEPIATVADLSRLWLDLEAYESQLPVLRWGQPVAFTVESHPGETFDGRVSFIEPMIDERTRTAAVRVAVDNTDGRLKPGMFASAVVHARMGVEGAIATGEFAGHWVCPMHPSIVKPETGSCDMCGMNLVPAETITGVAETTGSEEPLVIPRSAVLFTGTRSVVYVELDDAETPTYEGREVTLGPLAGDEYIVRDGLREGESVVLNGAFRVDSAMQIAAKPSMMAPDDGPAQDSVDQMTSTETPAAPKPFLASLAHVYTGYLEAQERLADDDFAGFVAAEGELRAAVTRVDATGLAGEQLAAWHRDAGELAPGGRAPDIEAARARFERMSNAAIDLQHRFGHAGDDTWHLVHCPMAFDFRGAGWIQRGETIRNPYFGSQMLRCGDITDTFVPRDARSQGGRADD